MSKFDYIFSDADKMLELCEDIEAVLNKYGLTLITYVQGDNEYEGKTNK